jgi:hypothetical protein
MILVLTSAWRDMKTEERKVTQANLGVLMDWSSCVNDIKNNGVFIYSLEISDLILSVVGFEGT